ncbi:hypothetical protein GBF38_018184, partial [Nibea albiflora]
FTDMISPGSRQAQKALYGGASQAVVSGVVVPGEGSSSSEVTDDTLAEQDAESENSYRPEWDWKTQWIVMMHCDASQWSREQGYSRWQLKDRLMDPAAGCLRTQQKAGTIFTVELCARIDYLSRKSSLWIVMTVSLLTSHSSTEGPRPFLVSGLIDAGMR